MRGNGTVTTYSYDAASRLSQLVQDVGGTAQDLTLGFAYTPAGQIAANTRSNEAYSVAPVVGTASSAVDGRNRLTQHAGAAPTYDNRGNLATEGGRTFNYSSENLLTGTAAGQWTMTFSYDPLMRYAGEAGGGLPRSYAYDGENMIVTNRNGQFLVRFVHGPGESEPLYQLDNLGRRYWYHADERGSIVAASDAAGTVAPSSVVRYDEYGEAPSGSWTFGYTGAFWLPLAHQWLLRARVYDPTLGRFLQPDRIGYGDGMNMYAYVGGDPLNHTDPSGERRTTEDENSLLERHFGDLLSPVTILRIPFFPSHTYPWEVDFNSRDYSADFAHEEQYSRRFAFWHEFYHVFEIQNHITPWLYMVREQAVNIGDRSHLYRYDPNRSFMANHFEARAEYFAGCIMGIDACDHLREFHFERNGVRIIFNVNSRRFEAWGSVTGTRILRLLASWGFEGPLKEGKVPEDVVTAKPKKM